jgi:GR25 family glycosyltransferase involved in LPS biosynthesis
MADLCYFSCLNFRDETRKKEMSERCKILNIDCQLYQGVSLDDERIKTKSDTEYDKRLLSATYGHLDMIYKFYYETNKEYGIFCEDDICIHKNLTHDLTDIIIDMKEQKLDMILLGYLCNFKIEDYFTHFDVIKPTSERHYKFHRYPNDLWGAQMYMITRKHAKFLLDKYYSDYSERSVKDTTLAPFSPDWTITKEGNKALIVPMYAVENGKHQIEHYGQNMFRIECHLLNYNTDYI